MFKEIDRNNIESVLNYTKNIYDRIKVSESDRKEINNLYWKAADAERENAVLKTKIELYEKFIAKMLESDPNKSNDVFMLDGEIYRLTNYTIDAKAGEPKALTVEFKCTSDITRIFKEKDDT